MLWHKAWLINVKNHSFKDFVKEISRYLQTIKGAEIYDSVSKNIKDGGLGLINLKERIIEILRAAKNLPEADNIIYDVGTKQQEVYRKTLNGPKSDVISQHLREKKIIT